MSICLSDNILMQVGGWTVNFLTSPGWSMALVWLLFLVVTILFFQDVSPNHRLYGQKTASKQWRRSVRADENVGFLHRFRDSILDLTRNFIQGTNDSLAPLLEVVSSESSAVVTSSAAASLQPVATCLLVYVMLKLCQELLTNSTPLVARIYFGWSPASSGIYLAILAIVLVPINMLFGLISTSFSDRKMVLFSQIAIAFGGLMMTDVGAYFHFSLVCFCFSSSLTRVFPSSIHVRQTQYLLGSVCVFIFSQVLEGFNSMSLSFLY